MSDNVFTTISSSTNRHKATLKMERKKSSSSTKTNKRKILVLHGDRQTGELLLGRIKPLKRKLLKSRSVDDGYDGFSVELIAPDGPFVWKPDPKYHHCNLDNDDDGNDNNHNDDDKNDNNLLRTWWYRKDDEYQGLDEVIQMLSKLWDPNFEGILGFSRGARLAHLLCTLHHHSKGKLFPGLKYVIFVSGYGDVPMPTNFPPRGQYWDKYLDNDAYKIDYNIQSPIDIPSLHIMGEKDRLISIQSSRALLPSYVNPTIHEHEGGHHIPMKSINLRAIASFIDAILPYTKSAPEQTKDEAKNYNPNPKSMVTPTVRIPDDEHALAQIEEAESLSFIFPEEYQLLSKVDPSASDEMNEKLRSYSHPITYIIQLKPSVDMLSGDPAMAKLWPPKNIALKVQYTADYPDETPIFDLYHDMNLLEFKINQSKDCLKVVRDVAESEKGMPCIMSCVYAAREYFESGSLAKSTCQSLSNTLNEKLSCDKVDENTTSLFTNQEEVEGQRNNDNIKKLKSSSIDRIHKCKLEGLEIANSILGHPSLQDDDQCLLDELDSKDIRNDNQILKGGSWKYTIGLVGKPSAGKSTFFNAASAFARQRGGETSDENGVVIGGATMAPHPFTTIDPNVGYCLVPAPINSCPEDNKEAVLSSGLVIGSTHGRDDNGRRFLPVMLKDVAGLVPGAYQGRGRGNKFLDDLTDADVLIHVVDASGTADTEGNSIGEGGSHPLQDLSWVQNELIQWIFLNLESKWDSISRRGRDKLVDMFSGYKQSKAFVCDVLNHVEQYMEERENKDRALDHLYTWDEGDLYRLVTAFLGARFPMALALNKNDLPTAAEKCRDVLKVLPLHGAHVGIPLSAHREMNFIKHHIYKVSGSSLPSEETKLISPPIGVWKCLQASLRLREPVLVFPVCDMITYSPLPGMTDYATRDSSLPNLGMISCLEASGGKSPTLWDTKTKQYSFQPEKKILPALRDVLTLKPGSTVEDVFMVLKYINAISGEFVRAEAVQDIGDKPKLVKKSDVIGPHNRIIKIMTTKRREWQKK